MALPSVSFVNTDSEWSQYYSKALLESNPDVARVLLSDTLEAISKRLSEPRLEDKERQSISVALRYVNLVLREEQQHKKSA
jgi:hypothetical protein